MPAYRLEVRREGVRLTAPDEFAVPSPVPLEEAHDWLLTGSQRGNRHTRLRPWTDGNAVRPLVHGRPYFFALGAAIERTRAGDLVLMVGWRTDPDEVVSPEGATIAQVLAAAARRGVDEAIYRASDGYLLEGPTAGLVFALEDRLWTTPSGSTGILPSVTVAEIFAVAERNGVDTGEALFTVEDAASCDGMWLVSAIRGVLPVLQLDGRTLHHDPAVTSVLSIAGGFPPID